VSDAVWAVVAVVAIGVKREQVGSWNDDVVDFAIPAAFWPLFCVFAIVVGGVWSLLWLGRGPIVFVRWMRRPKLPRAEVRRGR
jgi:hypothetical protein